MSKNKISLSKLKLDKVFNLYAFSKIEDIAGNGLKVRKGQLLKIKSTDAWNDCNCEWIRINKNDLEREFYIILN